MTTEIMVTQGFGAAKRLDDGRYRIIVFGEAEADLVMRAPELLEENEALKDRIADLESEAEVVSAEFEREMWKGVRSVLLDDCGWSADCFPATADNAIQGLREEMRHRGEEVVRLKDRIAELEAEKKWQPIETAPKDREILVCGAGKMWFARWNTDFEHWEGYFTHEPTHWIPLPKMEEE